jgi:hypothetical protein
MPSIWPDFFFRREDHIIPKIARGTHHQRRIKETKSSRINTVSDKATTTNMTFVTIAQGNFCHGDNQFT